MHDLTTKMAVEPHTSRKY